MRYKIDFINSGYRRYYKKHRKEILKAIDKRFKGGDFVLRDEIKRFEANLENYTGAKYAAGVNSGTDALKVAYKALGLKPGDEVITVGHVFIAPIQEIVHLGAKPVLIDIKDDGLMDVDLIEEAITKKTVGIVPVHLSGKVCDMTEICRIAKKYGLWVVEDACQALGASWGAKMAGTIGDIGCFSFISPKTLGGAGDAGGLVTNNKKLYEKVLLLRNHWNITQGALHGHQPKQPRIMGWGYNTRLDELQAAVLNVKFKYYPKMLKRRREIVSMYNAELWHLPCESPEQQDGQIYQEFIIRMRNEKEMRKFKKFMDEQRIELLIRDVIPNHKLEGLKEIHGYKLPVTEEHAKTSVRLPTYPELKNREVRKIIKAVQKFYGV